nr:uncharacterized protein LOC116828833 [Chelonoidis abingdonii]
MAPPALVHHTPGTFCGCPDYIAATSGPDHPGPRSPLSPRPPVSSPHGVEAPWLNPMELICLESVIKVLLGSRKPSTRTTYLAKWKRFAIWCSQDRTPLLQAPIPLILEYLLHLKQQVLVASSSKVHLAAISAFHLGETRCSVFAKSMFGCFLKGLEGLYSQVWQPIPTQDLTLVPSKLMGLPFKPLVACSLLFLSWKVAFLVTITSAKSERLQNLRPSPPAFPTWFSLRTRYRLDLTQLSFQRLCPNFTPTRTFSCLFFTLNLMRAAGNKDSTHWMFNRHSPFTSSAQSCSKSRTSRLWWLQTVWKVFHSRRRGSHCR